MLLALAMLTGCEGGSVEAPTVGAALRVGGSLASSVVAEDSGDLLPESDRAGGVGLVGSEKVDFAGTRKVWVRRIEGSLYTELVVAERIGIDWEIDVLLDGRANPDRPAIAEDGETVAFVSGVTGLASIFTVPFDGSADPVQQTNVGLEHSRRAPGAPPVGWVPPPIADDLHFDGDWLVWMGPAAEHAAQWRW